ncbi:MAG: hypothetical protein JSW71_07435 [Gemmatimonadota bacterium]|nr:MAG: hypothetical protein JSW71_07435 [Gemmatimonadota bacterium]
MEQPSTTPVHRAGGQWVSRAVNSLVLTLVGSVIGCTSSAGPTVEQTATGLVGSWDWLWSSGGIGGGTQSPESTGWTQRLEITSDSILRWFRQDTVVLSERISSVRRKTPFSADTADVIRIVSWGDVVGGDLWLYEFWGADTLRLRDLCYDCYDHVWARQTF